MKIVVKVKPGAHENKIEKRGEEFIISVKELPEEGKANKAVIRLLARHFNISTSRIEIMSGYASRNKRIEIL